MKGILSVTGTIFLLGLLFTTQMNLSSCSKETIIHDITHDTTIVNHHDTTYVILRDTVKLVLSPCSNPTESSVDSYFSTGTGVGVSHLIMGYWTAGSTAEIGRSYIKFDYSDLPADVIIVSAQLSLYADPTPTAGNLVDAHFGNANSIFIQRINSDWSPTTIKWNNQPTSITTNQVSLLSTTSNFQNDLNIDVSALVRDMLVNGNYGFALKLQDENNVYNIRQYASSYHTQTDKIPKLVINYKKK